MLVKEAARRLGVTESAIHKAVSAGHIKNVGHIGPLIDISEPELERYRRTKRSVGRPRRYRPGAERASAQPPRRT